MDMRSFLRHGCFWSYKQVGCPTQQLLLSNCSTTLLSGGTDQTIRVADLDGANFKTRDAATKALADLHRLAEPALRAALDRGPSAEARQRLNKLIAGLVREPMADEIRAGRAVKALELADTLETRALLGEWAGGAPGARLTEDAKAALGRGAK
jgi:hypothetical protein